MDEKMEDADKPGEWLHSCSTPGDNDIVGEPVKRSRIGEEYQAKIPPLKTEKDRLQLIVRPSSDDGKINHVLGLPVPLGWIKDPAVSNEETEPNQANTHGSESGLVPVPDSSIQPLSPDERQSFLLALYIFGKRLDAVNKFMGNKGMPNVLSYYYGNFYKTEEYEKWSKYRKMKGSKNTMPGKIVFSDWRKEELFSRLFPHVTEECRTSLTQASKMFEEGEVSFEAHVLRVRDLVGISLLREAIGLGKGRQDLTGRARKPVKKKIHRSLTTQEMVKLLSVKELKKEELSDLFWESVWPRLLARGWHSEKGTSYAFNTADKLVFLAPGITKFSRRGLRKGIQYFESFKDVLNKVASEPELLGPEPEPEHMEDKQVVSIEQEPTQINDVVDIRVEEIGVVRKSEIKSMPDTEPTHDMQDDLATTDADADGGEPLFVADHETITNQLESWSPMGMDHSEAEGTRNSSVLTTAKCIPSESMKKKREEEEEAPGPRHVRAKTSSDCEFRCK